MEQRYLAVPDIVRAPSVTALVREHADSRAHQEAVVFVRDLAAGGADALTYAELDHQARTVAGWLQRRLAPGERVLLPYPSGLAFAAAFVGCLYAGMVAVPTPVPGRYRHERRRVRTIAADAGARVVFTDSASLPAVREWASAEGIDDLAVEATDVAGFGDPDAWSMPATDPDTLAMLQYTSGSTADAKGVMVSHGNLLHNATVICRALDLDGRTRFGGWNPLFHDLGLMGQLLPALFLGSTCVLMSPASFLRRPELWLQMIDRYDIGWSSGPNFGYELCCRRITDAQIAQLDLSRWRFAINGSEPVQPSTMADFTKRFAAAGFRAETHSPAYGLAEATCYVSGSGGREPVVRRYDPELLGRGELRRSEFPDPGRELPSVGIAPGFEIRIVAPDTREVLPDGRIGEVWLRGPCIAKGYWHNEPATEATFRARTADGTGDFLRTGDLGALDGGELFVTGRMKEVMIIRGRNQYPQDIEHELRAEHPELQALAGAVFTVPVPGQEDALVVVHEVHGRPGTDELRALVSRMRQTVAREFGVPAAGVVLVRQGGVQRTTSGKIQRAAMRELFVTGALDSVYSHQEPRLRRDVWA